MSKMRTSAAAVAALSVGLVTAASAHASRADHTLATRPPVQLHPLATATPSTLADNTIGLLKPKSRPTTGGPETNGEFGLPFAEPTIQGVSTDAKCIKGPTPNGGAKGPIAQICKPAAGTLVNLPNGKILFWDALEGTENNTFSIVGEGGATFTNDSARLLTGIASGKPEWGEPKPFDGGANPQGNPGRPLIPGLQTTETFNDGALFGSHQSFLPDGRLLVQGGTDYSLEPGIDGIPFGAVELTGLKATRIYDPKTNAFDQTGDAAYRRWYPTLVETGDGKYMNFSGVGKLIKPIYTDPITDSLTNVKQIEQYDPATAKWSLFPKRADYDLPLYPRMSLLPNGHLFYNAAGQDFNPFGQSIGETNWNDLASFDPKSATWKKLGLANTANPLAPGFRGSTSSTMLPLKPDADGEYTKASYLTAGGVLLPSPGSYFATSQSSITTIDTAGGKEKATQKKTGSLNQVRWFGQNIALPTGEVVVFSGGDKDEVVGPGTEFPVQQAELFDPAKNSWKPIATAHNPRTYHNSAVLLPSGEVLVGGHATISTLYLNNTTLPGGFAPHDGRDPSFEVFKPPYLFRGPRPTISTAPAKALYGKTMIITMKTAAEAANLDTVNLVRNSAITHIVDADQRTVQLRVVSHRGRRVKLSAIPNGNVAPPGPYMLFANAKSDKGPIPSVAKQLFVGAG